MTSMDTEEVVVTELDLDLDADLICQALKNWQTQEPCDQPAAWRLTITCSCSSHDHLLCGDHKDWTMRRYQFLTCKACCSHVKITRVIPI